jgi:hypothetical protein
VRAPSLRRGRVCNLLLQVVLGLASAVSLGSKSSRTRHRILLFHLRMGPLSVASYESQGYDGGTLTGLHTEILTICWTSPISPFFIPPTRVNNLQLMKLHSVFLLSSNRSITSVQREVYYTHEAVICVFARWDFPVYLMLEYSLNISTAFLLLT